MTVTKEEEAGKNDDNDSGVAEKKRNKLITMMAEYHSDGNCGCGVW